MSGEEISLSRLFCKAAQDGRLAVVKKAVAEGLDLNEKDQNGFTALMLAAQNGHADVVEFLVGKGADINIESKLGHTALDWAKRKNHPEAAAILEEAARLSPEQRVSTATAREIAAHHQTATRKQAALKARIQQKEATP